MSYWEGLLQSETKSPNLHNGIPNNTVLTFSDIKGNFIADTSLTSKYNDTDKKKKKQKNKKSAQIPRRPLSTMTFSLAREGFPAGESDLG